MSIFTMHKSIPLNQWIAEEAQTRKDKMDYKFESANENYDYILNPNDYEAFINPRLVGETVTHEH